MDLSQNPGQDSRKEERESSNQHQSGNNRENQDIDRIRRWKQMDNEQHQDPKAEICRRSSDDKAKDCHRRKYETTVWHNEETGRVYSKAKRSAKHKMRGDNHSDLRTQEQMDRTLWIGVSSKMLHLPCRKIWQEGPVPTDWKKGYLIKLPNTGDLSKCEKYRGNTLL